MARKIEVPATVMPVAALAETLLMAGLEVTVWNRTVPKAELMVQQSAVLRCQLSR